MKLHWRACLLLIFVCTQIAWAKTEQLQQLIQNNTGTAINAHRDVNITIIQQSNDYKALKEKLDQAIRNVEKLPKDPDFIKELQQANENLTDFIEAIRKLVVEIDNISLSSERGNKAKAYFEKGDYQAARDVLDAKEMGNEKQALLKKKSNLKKQAEENKIQLDYLAADYILKARLSAFDYQLGDQRIPKTRQFFEDALELSRIPHYLFDYALFLHANFHINTAEELYREILKTDFNQQKIHSIVYLPLMAITLSNLGDLVAVDKGRYSEAEKFYKRSLEIYRDLARESPNVYLPSVVVGLNKLGRLFRTNNEYRNEAEKLYIEALNILCNLAKDNPSGYLPYLPIKSDHLGIEISIDSRRYRNKAENIYQEALEKYCDLEKANPVYLPDVLMTLVNLGALLSFDSKRRNETETLYFDSLAIARYLSKLNPEIYVPAVAKITGELGLILSHQSGRRDEAKKFLKESLEIYRVLAKKNQALYLPSLALYLYDLGYIFLKMEHPEQAVYYLHEAQEIITILAKESPEIFGKKLEATSMLLKQARGAR